MIRKLIAAAVVVISALVGAVPTANADPMADLLGMLPGGYGGDACGPAPPPLRPAALASVDCGANSLPGGPTHARYILYPDTNTMVSEYEGAMNMSGLQRVPCPGMQSNRPVPVKTQAGEQVALIACGLDTDPRFDQPGDGSPAILWVNMKDNVFGNAHGSDVGSLWDWLSSSKALV